MAIITGFLTVGSTLTGTEDGDQIYGNARGPVNVATGGDRIFGRGGDDVIVGDTGDYQTGNLDIVAGDIGPAGRGGNDLIQGGDGDDDLFGDCNGTLLGIGGDDILHQNAGRGLLVGDAILLAGAARCGNDQLHGQGILIGDAFSGLAAGYGDDVLTAGSGADTSLWGDLFVGTLGGTGVGGADLLRGGSGGNVLVGDAQLLGGAARGGNDQLWGHGGDDRLAGDAISGLADRARGGNDVLRGGAGDDRVVGDGESLGEFAQGGDDRLLGGAGDDELWGDGELRDSAVGGKDRFVFAGSFGDDSIRDFRTEDGDQIVLQGLTQSEVQLTIVTVTDPNDSTLITTLGDQSITLVGFTGPLTPGVDIVFA